MAKQQETKKDAEGAVVSAAPKGFPAEAWTLTRETLKACTHKENVYINKEDSTKFFFDVRLAKQMFSESGYSTHKNPYYVPKPVKKKASAAR